MPCFPCTPRERCYVTSKIQIIAQKTLQAQSLVSSLHSRAHPLTERVSHSNPPFPGFVWANLRFLCWMRCMALFRAFHFYHVKVGFTFLCSRNYPPYAITLVWHVYETPLTQHEAPADKTSWCSCPCKISDLVGA